MAGAEKRWVCGAETDTVGPRLPQGGERRPRGFATEQFAIEVAAGAVRTQVPAFELAE